MGRTEQQKKAVFHNEGNLIVSASAGSGKTSVMIERFVRLVTEKKASVKEILAVTFTRLAAEEMKERLAAALKEKISEGRDVGYLKEQLDLVPVANVSTVDSFCSNVIKRYFYIVDVDPTFSIADETAVRELKERAIKEVFDELYEKKDPAFIALASTFLIKRSDRSLKEMVRKIHELARSCADPEKFYDYASSSYSEEGLKNAENGLIGAYIDELDKIYARYRELISKCRETGCDKFIPYLSELIDVYETFKKRARGGVFDYLGHSLRKPSVRKEKDDENLIALSEEISSVNERLTSLKGKIKALFAQPEEERIARELNAGKTLNGLLQLVKLYGAEYERQKKDRNLLDYSDLEHLTLKILDDAEACDEIASSFKYIFVDEYQDTNGIQEAIFSKLERNDLFIVGDVKQCIYAFRGSKPDIFTQRIQNAEADSHVDLDCNFRSARRIVDAVNKVFSRVMTKERTGVDYAASPMVYGGLYPKEKGEAILRIVEDEEKKGVPIEGVYGIKKHLAAKKKEEATPRARAIVRIIEENVGKTYFDRSGEEKTLGYKDFIIITRTNDYNDVVSELARVGVPVVCEAKSAITDYSEVALAIDILTTIYVRAKDDNALFSVLKSCVCGLSDEEIYSVRTAYFALDFHKAVKRYSEDREDGIAEKLKAFYGYIDRLFTLSAVEGAATLLRRVIEEKKLDYSFLARRHGKLKVKRLERLIAGLYVGGEEYALGEFIAKKDVILSNITVADAGGENSVRIMTIHKSKGLEAPVVIVTGIEKDAFSKSMREQIYMHEKYGLGLDHFDPVSKKRHKSAVRAFIGVEMKAEQRLEEMRLLYVAMTRAEIKLYIVSSRPLGEVAFDDVAHPIDFLRSGDIDEEIVDKSFIEPVVAEDERDALLSSADEEIEREIEKNLSFVYGHEDERFLSLKRTVTGVAKETAPVEAEPPVRPIFATTDVEHGNAYHKFLEHSSLSSERVDEDLETLISKKIFGAKEAALLDKEKLKKILLCDVFKSLSGYELYREKPFIVNIPPALAGEKGKSEILLQGVIDLLAVKDGQAVIVDYKFSSASAETLAARYKKQVELYAFAVEKISGASVSAAYLLNVNSAETIKVI